MIWGSDILMLSSGSMMILMSEDVMMIRGSVMLMLS